MATTTASMDAVLPEEILREILVYNIHIPHAYFLRCWTGYESCGRRIACRSADALLVSKRWLRVGTPLLYACLVLSSPEHTRAVAALLREHPHVGASVRCLKLRGGLGKELGELARHLPNLQKLFIDLRIKAAHSVTGLKKALPLLAPIHLYLDRPRSSRDNKRVEEVRVALSGVINKWTSLVRAEHAVNQCTTSRRIVYSAWYRLSVGALTISLLLRLASPPQRK